MKLFKLIVIFAACKINSVSINKISCPKTEFTKKCLLFVHSSCFVEKNKTTKKENGISYSIPYNKFLSDNSEYELKKSFK